MKRNRYAYLYGLFKELARRRSWGNNHLGQLMAKKKVKNHYKVKSLKQLSDKQLKALIGAVSIAVYEKGWPKVRIMDENQFNKVQINRITKFGVDRFGKPIKETTHMFNVREDDPKRACELYFELLKEFYKKKEA